MRVLSKLLPAGAVRIAGVFAVGASLGMAAAAAVVYVAADRLDIVEKKRAVAKVVTTVERNASLTVLAKEGAWYKVEVGGKQGYVFEKAVSNKPGGKSEGVALSKVKGGPVSELELAAAARGADELTIKHASASGQSVNGLQEMFDRRMAITPEEYERHLIELRGTRAAAANSVGGEGGELLVDAATK